MRYRENRNVPSTGRISERHLGILSSLFRGVASRILVVIIDLIDDEREGQVLSSELYS